MDGGQLQLPDVSIHAPREGSDQRPPTQFHVEQSFNPRSPRRERRLYIIAKTKYRCFNPRSPRRERRYSGCTLWGY